MKEKKETKIAENISSGAEKVEEIEKTVQKKSKTANGKRTQETSKEEKIDVKKMNAATSDGKAEKESQAAKARVEAALKKQQQKQERKAAYEKARVKAAAERKAREEKRKALRAERIRERAHAKANRAQQRERERAKRRENQKRDRNYGGWLAAVISLGAVTLALTTALTVGAIEMKNMKEGMMAGYQSTTYELIGVVENVDNDLDRARVSATPEQQGRILTDLLVQARLAEMDLEKMPICGQENCNLTTFFNKVAHESERMLAKLRRGEKLTEEDEGKLQALYERAHAVKAELENYAANMQDNDIMDYIKKGEGAFSSMLKKLENATLPENRAAVEGKDTKDIKDGEEGKKAEMDGAGKQRNAIQADEDGSKKITPAQAEEMCKKYFSEYKIDAYQCIGETVAKGYTAYNLQGYDDNGTMLFAELDYKNGELIRFDYYEECQGDSFTMENAQTLADNFLKQLGYENMTAVRARENGTDVDFMYVYTQDGVVYYPDTVHVKVCRARGVVTGLDAAKYLKNHQRRNLPERKISLETAQSALHKGVEVQQSRVAVVKSARGERLAYEFVCSYNGEQYLIYTDATSGEEISILNLKNLG
jgi:germination protein YpeB